MTTTPLNDKEKQKCLDDAAYRLNCLMAYDLYLFIQNKYKNNGSVYATGHILEPSIEISPCCCWRPRQKPAQH